MELLRFLPPLTLLLRPSLLPGRDDHHSEWPDYPRHWAGSRLQSYVLGALLLGGINGAEELMTGSLSLQRSKSGGYRSGRGEWITSGITQATTAESGPLFVSSWVLGEPKGLYEYREDSPYALVGTTRVFLPDVAPGHYLRFVEFPVEPQDQPNIVLVMGDGRVVRLQRRVNLKMLPSVEAALAGAEDLTEIQRRIEQLLPPVSGQFPRER